MMSEPTIVSDPRVMMGKPVVAGTRATVDLPSDSPLRRFELKSSTRQWLSTKRGTLRNTPGL
jgi:hypothetical protein